MQRTGMVLGKFMPPHMGHVYLVEFARAYVDRLYVVVGSLPTEPIDGVLRYEWMCSLFPDVEVLHLDEILPQEPSEHPDFWDIWREVLLRVVGEAPEFVFASEEYGWRLAQELGARFVPVDQARSVMPVSGTAVRQAPLAHWSYLPRCVRPYYVRRVCVFGPESTGKSTLAKHLGEAFDTVVVPEYARTHIEAHAGELALADMDHIARGQMASEDALAHDANKLLICDTDLLTTTIWSEELFGSCAPWLLQEAERRTYDLYLLLDVDVPWVDDIVRYRPEEREDFYKRCRDALTSRGRPFVEIRGDWETRLQHAKTAVQTMLSSYP